jgi:hypothetical protein
VLFCPVLASTEFWNRSRFPVSTADCRLSKLREDWSFSSFLNVVVPYSSSNKLRCGKLYKF